MPEADAEARDLPPGLIASALRAPLRHWPLSLAAIIACGAIAVLAALAFSAKSWKADGVLLYTPLPDSESLKRSYNPEKLESFIALIKSTDDLETLRQEFDLPLTTEVMEKKLKVEQVPRSQAVMVSLEWGDQAHCPRDHRQPPHGTAHPARREHSEGEDLRDVDDAAGPAQGNARRSAATSASDGKFVNYLTKKDIVDIRNDRDRLDKEVAEAEKDVAEAKDKLAAYPQMIRDVDDEIAKLGTDLQSKSLADLQPRPPRKTAIIRVSARKDLEDISRDEDQHAEPEADKEYRDADREARSVEPLVSSGAIRRSEAEQLRAKADLLRLKAVNSEKKMKDMVEDLSQLPRDFFLAKAADLRKKRNDIQEEAKQLKSKIGRLEDNSRGGASAKGEAAAGVERRGSARKEVQGARHPPPAVRGTAGRPPHAGQRGQDRHAGQAEAATPSPRTSRRSPPGRSPYRSPCCSAAWCCSTRRPTPARPGRWPGGWPCRCSGGSRRRARRPCRPSRGHWRCDCGSRYRNKAACCCSPHCPGGAG